MARPVVGQAEIDIVADVQVEPAVAVEVREHRGRTPPIVSGSRARRDVLERSIALVTQ